MAERLSTASTESCPSRQDVTTGGTYDAQRLYSRYLRWNFLRWRRLDRAICLMAIGNVVNAFLIQGTMLHLGLLLVSVARNICARLFLSGGSWSPGQECICFLSRVYLGSAKTTCVALRIVPTHLPRPEDRKKRKGCDGDG